jgi:hypothetical protein
MSINEPPPATPTWPEVRERLRLKRLEIIARAATLSSPAAIFADPQWQQLHQELREIFDLIDRLRGL